MKNIYSVIKRPLFTEKGASLKESENKVLVEVDAGANKIEIKRAIEEIFKVKVEKVATVKVPSRKKRWGKSVGRVPERKKAIVTLREGQKLDFIEGV